MEIIEVDIYQSQAMAGGIIDNFVYVDIEQTQQAYLGDEARGFKLEPAFMTGVGVVRIERPRELPLIVNVNSQEPIENSFEVPIQYEGQIYLQLSRQGQTCRMFVAYNRQGPNPEGTKSLAYVPVSHVFSGAINPDTGTAWNGRQGNKIGDAI